MAPLAPKLFCNDITLSLCCFLTGACLKKPPIWYNKKSNGPILLYQHFDSLYANHTRVPSKEYVPPEQPGRIPYVKCEIQKAKTFIRSHTKMCNSMPVHVLLENLNLLLESEENNDYIHNSCAVCFTPLVVECILFPCAHGNICGDCAQSINICPFCRTPISNRILSCHSNTETTELNGFVCNAHEYD